MINTGEWTHAAVTYKESADEVKIYIDGQLSESTTSHTIDMCTTNTEVIQIGGHSGTTRWFDGRIDDVRIYDRVLTTAEISNLANGNRGGGTL